MTPSRISEYIGGRREVTNLEVLLRIVDNLHIPGEMFDLAPRAWEADEPQESTPRTAHVADDSVADGALVPSSLHKWDAQQTALDNSTLVELCDILTDYSFLELACEPTRQVSIRDLARDLDVVFSDFQRSRFTAATGRVTSLLLDAHFAVHQANDGLEHAHASEVLALAYHAAASVLAKLGQPDLALLAAERGLQSARNCESFSTSWSLKRAIAFTLLANNRLESTMRLIDSNIGAVHGPRLDGGAEISTYGTLFLVGALAAARFGDGGRAKDYLRGAEVAADRLGRDANYAWTAFGPTNVAIHRTNVSAELGEMHAVASSPLIPGIEAVPVERQVRYFLDIARARGAVGRGDAALETLLTTERVAPEHVRQHYLSRKLVADLMNSRGGASSTELTMLARRMRIQAA